MMNPQLQQNTRINLDFTNGSFEQKCILLINWRTNGLDPHFVFSLSSNDEAEITKMHRRLSLQFHPDRNAGNPLATQAIVAINTMKEELLHPKTINPILAFALQHPKLTTGLVGLFVAAIIVASIFSFGAAAGVAVAVGSSVGLSGTAALITGTAFAGIAGGVVAAVGTFFGIKNARKNESRNSAPVNSEDGSSAQNTTHLTSIEAF